MGINLAILLDPNKQFCQNYFFWINKEYTPYLSDILGVSSLFIQKRYLQLHLPPFQSCFLWGARKTGKSTYLRITFPDALIINLLDFRIYQKYLKNPASLEETVKAYPAISTIILDEVQKVPLLLNAPTYRTISQ